MKICRDHRAKAKNASFPTILARGIENQPRVYDFRIPSIGVEARYIFKNTYLATFFQGALSTAVTAAAGKGAPSGTHESLCVLEGVAPSKTTEELPPSRFKIDHPYNVFCLPGPL